VEVLVEQSEYRRGVVFGKGGFDFLCDRQGSPLW
jgi:hypothetical protein